MFRDPKSPAMSGSDSKTKFRKAKPKRWRLLRQHRLVLEHLEDRRLLATFSNSSVIDIPESGSASPCPSNMNVSGVVGNVTDVSVSISGLSHSLPDDIDILLVGPAGQSVVLMSDVGGNKDVSGVNLTFDDRAANALPDKKAMSSGTYKPTDFQTGDTFAWPAPAGPYGSTFSVFDGTDPNGTWSLYVMDDSNRNLGRISSGWSLSITTATTDVDPKFIIDDNLPASPGRLALVPVKLDVESDATNVGFACFRVYFDSTKLSIDPTIDVGVKLGAATGGWILGQPILEAPGRMLVEMYGPANSPLPAGTVHEVAKLYFRVDAAADLGTTPLDIEPKENWAGAYYWTADDGSLVIGEAPPAPVIITEIMYDPNSQETVWEWVELYNPGSVALDLTGYVLDDNDANPVTDANIESGTIPAGGAGVLYNSIVPLEEVRTAWGADINWIAVTNWSALGPTTDRVGLWRDIGLYTDDYTTHNETVDDVSYQSAEPWPPKNNSASIYLTDLALDNSLPGGWSLSVDEIAGAYDSSVTSGDVDNETYFGNTGNDIGSPGIVPWPVVVNHSATLDEGASLVLTSSHLSATDPDSDQTALIFTVKSLPAQGVLKKDDVALAVDGTFTQADISDGRISYTHDDSETTSDTFTFAVKDPDNHESAVTTFTFTVNPVNDSRPEVEGVVINAGLEGSSSQRSMVRNVTVTFNTTVTIDAGAFALSRRDVAGVVSGITTFTAESTSVHGKTVVTVTFAGGSLHDGNYLLTIDDQKISAWGMTLLGDGSPNGDFCFGDQAVDGFFRLFGDSDGDRDVDTLDYTWIRSTYLKTNADSGFLWYFDYDSDNDVDSFDMDQFLARTDRKALWSSW